MERICQVELGFVPWVENPKFSNRKTWLLHSLSFFELLKIFRNSPLRDEQPPHASMATIIIARYEMFFSSGSRRISKSRAHVPMRRTFRERDGRTTQERENGNLNFLLLRCSEYFNYGTPCVDGSGAATSSDTVGPDDGANTLLKRRPTLTETDWLPGCNGSPRNNR